MTHMVVFSYSLLKIIRTQSGFVDASWLDQVVAPECVE
jgi:hypothetical protein